MRRIALLAENSREYGRELLKGVAAWAQERRDWILRPVTPAELRGRAPFAGFDGVIARVASPGVRRRILESGLPAVDVFCQRADPGFIGVDCDHAAIARAAADFFLRRGFSSFAFCGFAGTAFSDARRDAFAAAVAAAGFRTAAFGAREPPDDSIFFAEKADLPRVSGELRAWTRSLPTRTALFCANDLRAYQILRIAAESSILIPQDLSVLGVDDDSLLCSFATPPLSSIDPNARGVGYAAARLLQAAMDRPAARKSRPVLRVRPGELEERASTEFHPVEPAWLSDALVWIDRNMAQPVTAADIVALSGLSYPTVEKTFRRVLGCTAGEYVMRVKMEEAKRLAERGGLSSKEIAARTGFSTPQYFCTAFRRFHGRSPLA